MAYDPLAMLAKLREIELRQGRRSLAEAQAAAAQAHGAAAAAEAALRAERPDAASPGYGAFLAHGLAEREVLEAAAARADAAAEAGREALALARGADRLIAILRGRRAAAARRLATRRAQARLEDARAPD